MPVLLSDEEAENVATLLRRMHERITEAPAPSIAYVDDRSPEDYANQLEALVDGGDPTVYVPLSVSNGVPSAMKARVTHTDAVTAATKVRKSPTIQEVPVVGRSRTGEDE